MDEDTFREKLQDLIDAARGGETIRLALLADIVASAAAGLEMAADEGEAF